MAIVTISRIQHRRGVYENLPQLAAAELGWAVDQRRLFVGNGSLAEGAPEVGNTEILTQYSDILSVADTYTFKNAIAGYTPSTGPDANDPTVRTLQDKLDDFVSVRDFGAKGDGATDDTVAINRALFELYCREDFSAAKKALYFPAGHYIISDTIKVPPHATLIGEGPFSTMIEQTADLTVAEAVFSTSDDLQQTEGSIGSNGANLPTDIKISSMGLMANLDGIHISKCKRITLERIRFLGVEDFPTSINNTSAGEPGVAIYLAGSTASPTDDVNIIDCYFHKHNIGIWQNVATEVIENINISSATFDNLYQGILIGILGGTAKNVVVTNSVFDNIYSRAINVDNVEEFISSFNHFRNVGNSYNGTGNPVTEVINFGISTVNSASMGDLFDRTEVDNAVVPTIVMSENNSFYNYGKKLNLGFLGINNGREITLTDNSSASTDVSFDSSLVNHAVITYNVNRLTQNRSGVLNISLSNGTYSIDDDSTETGDVGVIFDISFTGSNATLTYTTTSTGNNATMYYSVTQLTNVV